MFIKMLIINILIIKNNKKIKYFQLIVSIQLIIRKKKENFY